MEELPIANHLSLPDLVIARLHGTIEYDMGKSASVMGRVMGAVAALAIFAHAGDARAFNYGLWRSGMTVEEADQALVDEHQTVKFRGSVFNFESLVTVSGDALYFCHGALIAFSRNIPDKDQAFSILEDMRKAGRPKVEKNNDSAFGKPHYASMYEWLNDEGFVGIDVHSTSPLNIDEIGSADDLASKVDLAKQGFRKVWWKLIKCEPK